MIATILLLCLQGAGAQEDKSGELQSWLEKLSSDRIEEREQANHRIRSIGKAAIPELEKVAGAANLEAATRARTLIRLIRLKELLGVDVNEGEGVSALTVINWMEKKTGRKFIYSEELGLRNAKVQAPEKLIETGDPYVVGVDLLRLANLAVTPGDSAPDVVEIFPAPLGGKKGVKVFRSVEDLPKANEFCTLVLHPRHVSPRSVQAVLINLVSFPQNCLCIEESGTVVVSDYASVLRKCSGIMNELDVARSFRVSVALLEGRTAKESSIPEPYRNLRLTEITGLNHFASLGTASLKLQRVVLTQVNKVAEPAPNAIRFPGTPSYLVAFDGLVRAEGGPTLDRFAVRLDQEPPVRLFEGKLSLKDENWMVAGSVSIGEGASLVILVRAVAE